MKKILSALMIVACLFMAMPAQAQFQFGLKGGLNISKLTFSEDIVKGDNRTGFFIGPMVNGQGAAMALPVWGLYMQKVYKDKTFGIFTGRTFQYTRRL